VEQYERSGDQLDTTPLVYEPNPKHKPIPTPGRHGSICPPHADGPALLLVSDLHRSKRYATDGSAAYCAQRHDLSRNAWHGYPIDWDEVPPALVHSWIAEDKVDRRTVQRAKWRRDR
jgi:hypothetical protein